MEDMKGIKRHIDSRGRITIPAVFQQMLGINTDDKGTWKITKKGNLLLELEGTETGLVEEEL